MKGYKNIKRVIMVGPDSGGYGGISKVVKVWQENAFFTNYNIKYISSVSDKSGSRLLYLINGLFKFVIYLICGPSLVYIHTSSQGSFYRKSLFIVVALFFRKKVVLHIHPSHFCQFISDVRGLKGTYICFLLQRIYAFVVLTGQVENYILGLYPDKPVYILKNPVDLKKMVNKEAIERSENSILYLGWFIKKKGVYDLVDAIAKLVQDGEDVCLDCYGTKEVEKLKSYVSSRKLTKEIRVHGWIDSNKIIDVLYDHKLLILPSYSEGIPNVILEAMATKTPIISTLVGGLKEILIDGENAVIVKTGNVQDISEKILKCIKNQELMKRITENAYNDVRNKYDIGVIKKRFGEIVGQLLN